MISDSGEPASFGDLVRQYRLDARLTQAALAERAGISLRAVQDLERCIGRPRRETTRRLAEAFALTAESRAQFDRAAAPAPRVHKTARSLPAQMDAKEGQPERDQGKPEEPGGEQKCVTILIADVAGLTESVHGFEPDLADRVQSSLVPVLVDVIHGSRGTVNRVGGDGIMAIFGAPAAHEDDAVQACLAALALHEAFEGFASRFGAERGLELSLRVGLASSDVVLRSTSNDVSGTYTALGPAVRVATRLVQAAAGGTTLLTAETVRAAEGYISVRLAGSVAGVANAGPAAGIQAFELLGGQPPRTRFQRVVTTRQLTRFVGRDAELMTLATALGAATAGRGQIVALVGDPGVGKSRLIWEATRSARTDGWLVLESGAVSHAATPSYGPVVDLLRGYCGIEAHDDGEAVRKKVTDRVLALDTALAPDLVPLLALLDARLDDTEWEASDPPRRRGRTLTALKRLVLRQAQEAPLLLVIEDLHWIDGETQAFLDALVDGLPVARLLLLISYRPEYEHQWIRKSCYAQLHVDALASPFADELLGALLGDDASLHALRQALIVKTEGNPLFLEESVRSLVDAGALAGERGAYHRATPIDTIRVPDTVQTVIGARIDRLEHDAKHLLQVAAVIGKDVPFSLLRAVVDVADDELRGSLARLLAAEFIYEGQLFLEPVYTFKHALTREVAYASLLQERRRTLHARIVDAIERMGVGVSSPDPIAEQIDNLAHHAVRGQLWDKAVSYLRRAAQRDAARSANRQSARYFEQALDALNHLPNHRDAWELGIDIRLELRNVLLPLAEFRSMFDHLQTAEALAIALDDHARLGWVSAYQAAYYCNFCKPREAEAAALRAMAIADECGELPLQVMAHFFLGLAYVYASRYEETREPLRWNVERLRGDLIYERFGEPGLPSIFSRSYLIRALAETGDFDEALARGNEAVRLAELTNFPLALANALEGLGYVHLRRGNLREAIVLLERGLQICRQWQVHLSEYVVEAYLGCANAHVGRDAEAVQLLEQSATIDSGFHPALRVTMLGEAHLLGDRLDLAQQCVDQALAIADVGEEHGSEAWALRLAAEIALAHGLESADRALQQYRGALALAMDLGMRPLQAHCRFGLGKLHRRIGHLDDARVELSAAVSLLDDLEMAHWLPEAEAELAAAGGPLDSHA